MKTFLPALAFLVALTTGSVRAQQTAMPGMPAGMKGSYESVEGTIEKIYSAERDGFHATAYVVKWHDQEVVVPDMFASGDKKVGDKVTFMASEMEVPIMGKSIKILQFMAMDPEGMMKMQGAPAPAASESPTSTPQ